MSEGAPEFVYTLYIAASPERVWSALTDGELTRQYWGHENCSDWKPGSRWEHVRAAPSGEVDVAGRVIEIDPPRRLVTSWVRPSQEGMADKTSRVTYELDEAHGETRLTVTHSDIRDPVSYENLSQGWPLVLSSLKSFLEKGDGLEVLRRESARWDKSSVIARREAPWRSSCWIAAPFGARNDELSASQWKSRDFSRSPPSGGGDAGTGILRIARIGAVAGPGLVGAARAVREVHRPDAVEQRRQVLEPVGDEVDDLAFALQRAGDAEQG